MFFTIELYFIYLYYLYIAYGPIKNGRNSSITQKEISFNYIFVYKMYFFSFFFSFKKNFYNLKYIEEKRKKNIYLYLRNRP